MPNSNALTQFGNRLRDLRLQRELSQERLAELAGLHRTYLGGVERGERNVSLINLVAIANALDLPLSTLFEGIADRNLDDDMRNRLKTDG